MTEIGTRKECLAHLLSATRRWAKAEKCSHGRSSPQCGQQNGTAAHEHTAAPAALQQDFSQTAALVLLDAFARCLRDFLLPLNWRKRRQFYPEPCNVALCVDFSIVKWEVFGPCRLTLLICRI